MYGFLVVKHFNRCKCLHPLICIPYTPCFDELHGVVSDEMKSVLHSLDENPSEANLKDALQPDAWNNR